MAVSRFPLGGSSKGAGSFWDNRQAKAGGYGRGTQNQAYATSGYVPQVGDPRKLLGAIQAGTKGTAAQFQTNQDAYKQAIATASTQPAAVSATGQYETAITEAQAAANTQREALQAAQAQREALATQYGQREQELTRYLEGMGTAERGNLSRQRDAILAQQQQDLLNRGMTSTTAYDSAVRGTNQAYNQDLSGLEERLQRQAMDYRTMLSGETLGSRSLAIEGSAKTAADVLAAQSLPIEYRGALAQQHGDLSKTLASQAGQFAGIGADRDIQLAKLAQDAQIANQQAALQRMGLDAETALGYAKLQNNISVAKAGVDPFSKARASAMNEGSRAIQNYASNNWMYLDENSFMTKAYQNLLS